MRTVQSIRERLDTVDCSLREDRDASVPPLVLHSLAATTSSEAMRGAKSAAWSFLADATDMATNALRRSTREFEHAPEVMCSRGCALNRGFLCALPCWLWPFFWPRLHAASITSSIFHCESAASQRWRNPAMLAPIATWPCHHVLVHCPHSGRVSP